MDRLLLRMDEVSEAIGIGRSKVYELVAGGDIPSVRIGRALRVPADGLRRWVDEQVTRGAEETEPVAGRGR